MTHPSISFVPEHERQTTSWLPLERAADVAACGGKAASLGRMLRAGLPVPTGVVLSAHAFDEFLEANGLRQALAALEASVPEARQAHVQQLFERARLPEGLRADLLRIAASLPGAGPLVVRSSAAGEDAVEASYAGLLDSVLHVDRGEGLERAIRQVWASRWSARAAAYAAARGKPLGSMGVIVQVQVDARAAGVLFTRSPEPGRSEEMLCEYCAGLADRLVAGEITPQRVAIDRTTLALRYPADSKSADAGELGREPVEALATAALAAERIFGRPQDIEWAVDRDERLWLVQARPITTPAATSRRRIVWSNANVNENFPAPISPLLYSVASLGYTQYFRNLGRAFGLSNRRLARIAPQLAAIIGVHGGRMYYNLTAIHDVLRLAPYGERLVAWFDEFTGASTPHAARPDAPRRWVHGLRDACELVRIVAKTAWQYAFIERRVAAFEARIDAYAAASTPQCLEQASLIELRDLVRGFLDIRMHRWTDAALADAAAMACYGALKATVAAVVDEADGAHAHNALLKGLSEVKSAEPVNALWQLADTVRNDPELAALFRAAPVERIAERLAAEPRHASFHASFQSYLEQWGFRCSGELMLTVASFQERPLDLLEIVRAYAAMADTAPLARLAAQRAERETITARVLDAARRQRLLRWLPGLSKATWLRPLLAATQAAIGLRERARLKQALLYSRLRRIALAIGERLAAAGTLSARDDVFFLGVQELDQLLSGLAMFPSETAALVALRRAAHRRYETLTPADVLIAAEGDYPDATLPAPNISSPGADSLRGAGVCGGIATGTARVLTEVGETRTLAQGDILVTRQTDPGWAPAFVVIGGLVLERGGMLSHGAILAREYGIPTVVGIAGATTRFASGDRLRIDGDHGDVQRIA